MASLASADSDYARWAQDQLADGCTSGGQSDPGYTAASAPNQQATASKTAFVRLWNPLAKTYGLPGVLAERSVMREGPIMNGHGLRLRSRRPAAPASDTAPERRAAEFAWRVHTAQANWANHADVKASILLVLEGGALYAVLSALSVAAS